MEMLLENILIYGGAILICIAAVWIYLSTQRRHSKIVEAKIIKAKQEGLYEPVSLHPVVNENVCIGSGACITACPEKDILGIRNGKATTINASLCIGHGACFYACPTQAILLCLGTEKRGIDLPHVNPNFESNVPGIFIAGELGGMGLIKNAMEQGQQAVENMAKMGVKNHKAQYDLVVVGAGPAGIGASLMAKKHHLNSLLLEQDTLGGAVFTYPRSKIVMTTPMNLPLYGKVKLSETSKSELLDLWKEVLGKNEIAIKENSKVDSVSPENGHFRIATSAGEAFTAKFVLLAVGRRGTPRKLNIPGESLEKVAYRLLEPEIINGKEIIVVGGGDSAIEAALALAGRNHVILSYRGESFSRIKPKNNDKINEAVAGKTVDLRLNTNLVEIGTSDITLNSSLTGETEKINNDLVYIFAGGELPTEFLIKAGIQITKKHGEAVLKHK